MIGKSMHSKIIIFLSFTAIIMLCTGCNTNQSKTTTNVDIDSIQENIINYLTEQGYNIASESLTENEFIVQGEKGNKNISVNFIELESDYSRCTIVLNNEIEDYTKKYNSIDYGELSKLSQLLGIEKISDNKIKKACEDKRDYYDSSDSNYLLPNDKIMSKIYRVGFFENPIIEYELSSNTKPSETVTILWNS